MRLLLILFLAIILFACKPNENPPDPDPEPVATDTTYIMDDIHRDVFDLSGIDRMLRDAEVIIVETQGHTGLGVKSPNVGISNSETVTIRSKKGNILSITLNGPGGGLYEWEIIDFERTRKSSSSRQNHEAVEVDTRGKVVTFTNRGGGQVVITHIKLAI